MGDYGDDGIDYEDDDESDLGDHLEEPDTLPPDSLLLPEGVETCAGCGDGASELGNEMLLCDSPSCVHSGVHGWHLRCLNPPLEAVPDDEWICPACSSAVVAEGLPKPWSAERKGVVVPREESSEEEDFDGRRDEPASSTIQMESPTEMVAEAPPAAVLEACSTPTAKAADETERVLEVPADNMHDFLSVEALQEASGAIVHLLDLASSGLRTVVVRGTLEAVDDCEALVWAAVARYYRGGGKGPQAPLPSSPAPMTQPEWFASTIDSTTAPTTKHAAVSAVTRVSADTAAVAPGEVGSNEGAMDTAAAVWRMVAMSPGIVLPKLVFQLMNSGLVYKDIVQRSGGMVAWLRSIGLSVDRLSQVRLSQVRTPNGQPSSTINDARTNVDCAPDDTWSRTTPVLRYLEPDDTWGDGKDYPCKFRHDTATASHSYFIWQRPMSVPQTPEAQHARSLFEQGIQFHQRRQSLFSSPNAALKSLQAATELHKELEQPEELAMIFAWLARIRQSFSIRDASARGRCRCSKAFKEAQKCVDLAPTRISSHVCLALARRSASPGLALSLISHEDMLRSALAMVEQLHPLVDKTDPSYWQEHHDREAVKLHLANIKICPTLADLKTNSSWQEGAARRQECAARRILGKKARTKAPQVALLAPPSLLPLPAPAPATVARLGPPSFEERLCQCGNFKAVKCPNDLCGVCCSGCPMHKPTIASTRPAAAAKGTARAADKAMHQCPHYLAGKCINVRGGLKCGFMHPEETDDASIVCTLKLVGPKRCLNGFACRYKHPWTEVGCIPSLPPPPWLPLPPPSAPAAVSKFATPSVVPVMPLTSVAPWLSMRPSTSVAIPPVWPMRPAAMVPHFVKALHAVTSPRGYPAWFPPHPVMTSPRVWPHWQPSSPYPPARPGPPPPSHLPARAAFPLMQRPPPSLVLSRPPPPRTHWPQYCRPPRPFPQEPPPLLPPPSLPPPSMPPPHLPPPPPPPPPPPTQPSSLPLPSPPPASLQPSPSLITRSSPASLPAGPSLHAAISSFQAPPFSVASLGSALALAPDATAFTSAIKAVGGLKKWLLLHGYQVETLGSSSVVQSRCRGVCGVCGAPDQSRPQPPPPLPTPPSQPSPPLLPPPSQPPKRARQRSLEEDVPSAYRGRVCFHFLSGMCAFGNHCGKPHPPPNIADAIRQRLAKTQCPYGEQCDNPACLRSHMPLDNRSHKLAGGNHDSPDACYAYAFADEGGAEAWGALPLPQTEASVEPSSPRIEVATAGEVEAPPGQHDSPQLAEAHSSAVARRGKRLERLERAPEVLREALRRLDPAVAEPALAFFAEEPEAPSSGSHQIVLETDTESGTQIVLKLEFEGQTWKRVRKKAKKASG